LGIACVVVLVGIVVAVIFVVSPKAPPAAAPTPSAARPTTSPSAASTAASASPGSDVFPGGFYVEAGTSADDAANRLVQEGQKSAAALV